MSRKKTTIVRPLLGALMFLSVFFGAAGAATTHTWTGNSGTAWGTPTNWTNGGLANGDAVILESVGVPNLPTNQNIGGLSLTSITFDALATTAIAVAGSGITLTGPGIIVQNGSGNHSLAASVPITLGSSQTWTLSNNAPGTFTVNSIISGAGMNLRLSALNGATLVLGGNNSFSGGLVILSGTVRATVTNGFGGSGAGNIVLGDATGGSNSATLQGGSAGPYLNPITVAANTGGALLINSSGANAVFNGAITLNNNLSVSASGNTCTFGGGITGTGNLIFANAGTNTVAFQTTSVNMTGQIINNSTGSGACQITTAGVGANVTAIINNTTGTGVLTIGAGAAGSNVSTITQNSSTANMTISGALTVPAGGITFTNNGTGTRIITVSGGVTGTGNITLNNNSAQANGILFTTNAINMTGAVTNSGTNAGTGTVVIQGGIGQNVTAVTQNSTTSALTSNTLGVTVGSSGLTLTNSSGGKALTVGITTSGSGNLTLVNNSALAAGINVTQAIGNTGNLTLNNNSTGTITISGAVNTVGNVYLNNSSTGGLTISGSSNNTGTITNQSSGSGQANLSGGIGTNVTTVTNNSTNSALVISNGLVLNAGGTTITNNSSASVLTVANPISGTGNLSLVNNSGAATGITISGGGAGINFTGTITNTGTGNSITLVSGVVGANVTGVIENSVSSQLTLSNANGYSNPTTIKAGTLRGNNATSFGTSAITMGDNTVNQRAVLMGGGGVTFTNTITVASNTGKDTICSNGANPTFNGAITLFNPVYLTNTANNITFGGGFSGNGNIECDNNGTGTMTIQTNAINNTGTLTLNTNGSGPINVPAGITTTGNLALNANSTGVITLSGSVNNTGTLTNSGSGSATNLINGAGTIGNHVTNVYQNSITSALTLATANTYTGSTYLQAGTLRGNNATSFSGGTIYLGDGGVNQRALLQGGGTVTFANPINLVSNTGKDTVINIAGVNATFSGAVTLNNNLTISQASGSGNWITLSGAVSGTGNIILNGLGTGAITLSNAVGGINNAGTITNLGSGTATNVLSGNLGAAVTGVIENSATSPLTLSGASPTFAGGCTIRSGTLRGNTNATAFGTASITLGDAATAANATLSGIGAVTFANLISVANCGAATATINSNGGNAVFSGGISLNHDLVISTISGNSLTLTGGITGTGNITTSANSTGAINITTNNVNMSGAITNSGTNTGLVTIGANITGPNVTTVTENSSTSVLALGGANTFTGGATIKSGTLRGSVAAAFGTGAITVGDVATAANATLSGTGAVTFTNLITVANCGAATATINSNGANAIFGGAVSLSHDLVLSPAGNNLTLSGGITGTGNLTLKTTGGGAITLSGSSVNMTGTITNASTGAGLCSITGGVGSNVSTITEMSATSNFTISATALSVANPTTLINDVTSTRTLTVSGGVTSSGASSLILQNNSSVAAGITISGSVNNTGSVTNSGSGSGSVIISGGVGSNVTSITENSGTSPLTIQTAGIAVNSTATTLINNNGSGTQPLTVAIGISGSGNLVLQNNSSIASGIAISGSVNNAGTITNSGGGGSVVLSGGVGANVTTITENSAASPLTIQTSAITVNTTATTLINNNASGSAVLSVTGGVVSGASGNLILQNNSNIPYGITLSGTSVNNAGAITNSGTGGSGAGSALISANIGLNVTGVTQNSASSQLVLTGNGNSYPNPTTITTGYLSVSSPGVTAGGSAVTVAAAGALAGDGTVGGTVDASATGAVISPAGANSPGTLYLSKTSATTLTLGSGSLLNFDIGSTSDKIVLSGASSNLVLGGTINVVQGTGFGVGTYPIITYTGTLTNTGLTVAPISGGFSGSILVPPVAPAGEIDLVISRNAAWNGSASSDWSNGNNWTSTPPNTAPTTGYSVTLTGSGSNPTNQLITPSPLSLYSLTFDGTTASPFTVSGNDLAITGTGIVLTVASGAANHILACNLGLGSSQTWELDNSGTFTVNGAISSGAARTLTKTGTGTLVLAGTNTCTGTLAINAGTVSITGSTAAGEAFTVGAGGTLAGNGTVGGSVTASAAGATISPAGSGTTGTLNMGSLSLGSGSVLNFDLATPAASDKIVLTGALTLDGTININGLSGFNTGTYTIITAGSAPVNNVLNLGTIVPAGYGASIAVVGNNVQLTITNAATWNGSYSTKWGDLQNWSTGAIPGAGTSVVLTGAGGNRPTDQNIAGLSINDLTFDATTGAVITITSSNASNITITGSGTSLVVASGAGNHTLGVPVVLGANQGWNFNNTGGTFTVTGAISGGYSLDKSGTGKLVLAANNGFSGGLNVKAGTVSGQTNANAFGTTGSITIGDASGGSQNATISGELAAGNFANPITVASTNTGTATITNNASCTFSGAITLGTHDLTIATVGANTLTLSGGVSGTGNLTLTAPSTGTITLQTNTVNNAGTITNNGAGSATSTISAAVGSSVTGITEWSNNSPFTVSGQIAPNTASGTTITNNGTALLTISGGSLGSGNLIFSNNSTAASGITVTTNSLNNTGTITNSGSSTGGTLISTAVIGVNVTGVTQASASSPLTLSAANTFGGGVTILAGTVTGTTNAAAFGTGTITLGNSLGGAADATLVGGVAGPITNAITIASINTGTATITSSGANCTFSGAVTLTSHNLTLQTGGANTLTLGAGGISGTGNLTLNATANQVITLNGAVNIAGTISNSGGGSATNIINGNVAANVTGITQSSTGTSALTIQTGTLTANNVVGTTITNTNGNAILTISDNVAAPAGFLILKNNSNVNDVIKLSAGSINNAGTITNSGTGTGETWISGVIAANPTKVYQNSSTSALLLTGANTNANGITIQAGTLNGTTGATPFGSGAITIGNASGALDATLTCGTAGTYSNAISVASGNTGNAIITSTAAVNYSGNVALNTHDLQLLANGGNALTLSGNVSGTGNIVMNCPSGASGVITMGAAGSINNAGTITNNGAGSATNVISGGVGANVTSIVQNSATSALNVTGSLAPNNSPAITLANNGGAATALLTVSGGASGSGNIIIQNNSSTDNAVTLSGTSVNNTGAITNSGAGPGIALVSAVVGASVTGMTQNSATSQLALQGANLFTGALTIKTGSVSGTVAGAFGAGSVVIGDASGSANATLIGGGNVTFATPITVASGNTGIATITSTVSTANFGGAVTLNKDLYLSPAAYNLTLSGTISGSANIIMNSTDVGVITLGTGSINTSGTITNSGAGSATNVISGGVGANVTGITQNSTTSALNVTGSISPNATAITLTNSSGTSQLTVSGGASGAGNILFQNNNSTAGGITVSGTSINNTGTITNSGTGTGNVPVGAVIGSNVTGVVQNSATSQLILSNTNTFTGTNALTINAGSVVGTVAAAFGAGTIVLGNAGITNDTLIGGGNVTFANPITVAAGNTAVPTITSTANTANFSGAVTLNKDFYLSPAAYSLTLSGSVSGTGNIIMNATDVGVITLGTGTINNAGSITNSGTGSAINVISGGVGTNVTAITENSATSALNVTGSITPNATAITLSNSSGLLPLTVSGGASGAGNIILQNNSSTDNAMTVSGTSINNTGTVTNNGTGPGLTLVSAAIGANVAGVAENSAASALTLSGTNTYTGPTAVTAGTLNLTGSTAAGSAATINTGGTLVDAGTVGGTVTINSGGTLSGAGTVSGAVTVNGGGTLASSGTLSGGVDASASGAIVTPAGSPTAGTITMGTSLTLGSGPGSVLNFDLGPPSDQIALTGNLTLAGTININNIGAFSSGTYTIITYTGTLTDNDLTLGSVPLGYNVSITAGSGQVNLVIGSAISPSWSVNSLGRVNGSAIVPTTAVYVGTQTPNNLSSYNPANGNLRWTYSTNAYGTCRNPSFFPSGGGYNVLASAGNYVVCVQDNGTSATPVFATADLGSAPGTPYATPDNSSFFVAFSNTLSKRNITTGNSIIDVSVPNISTSADIVVYNDFIYVATTDGNVHKGDATDFTPLSTYAISGSPSVTLPLIITDTVIYVAPNNATLHAVKTSTMAAKWPTPFALRGANTGAPYSIMYSNVVYTAAGNFVQKILDNGTSASEAWFYDAHGQVASGPILWNTTVYFGRNTHGYYAVNDADGSLINLWPYMTATGDATAGPVIDQTNSRVLFSTTGGNLDAFPLQ